MDRVLDGVTRALEGLLGRCAGLLPPGRRGWAEAVRAEAGQVPAGSARAGWRAGGLLVVALWDPTRSAPAPGVHAKTDVPLLFVVLVAVIAVGTAALMLPFSGPATRSMLPPDAR